MRTQLTQKRTIADVTWLHSMDCFQANVVEQVYPRDVPASLLLRYVNVSDGFSRETPFIRMHGYGDDGTPVTVWAPGFEPYLYVESGDLPPGEASALARFIETASNGDVRVQHVQIFQNHFCSLECARAVNVARVTVQVPKQVAKVRSIWLDGRARLGPRELGSRVWEANVKFHERFMIDHEMVPGCWVPLPPEHTDELTDPCDRGDIQESVRVFVLHEQHVRGLPVEGDNARNAPMPLLAFDLECKAPLGEFPNEHNCQVIQISDVLFRDATGGDDEKNVLDRRIMTTGGEVAPFPADHATPTQIQLCTDEADLLLEFARYANGKVPAFYTNYNGDNFDWPILVGRARQLGIADEFCALIGRDRAVPLKLKKSEFSSNARGDERDYNVQICGAVNKDMLRWVRNAFKFRSYKLDDVVKELVSSDAGKVPIHHSEIPRLYDGTPEERRLLSEYCVLDAELAARILLRQRSITNDIEMARVTGVDVHGLITSGQQTKVHNQLLRACRRENMLVPTHASSARVEVCDVDDDCSLGPRLPFAVKRGTSGAKKPKAQRRKALYSGATVIDPKRGFYTVPITTLDFSSLYPSIMNQHNLCYSTLVAAGEYCEHGHNATASDEVLQCCVEKTPNDYRFWRKHVREGILPRILRNLLAARGAAKRKMAEENKLAETLQAQLEALEAKMRTDGYEPGSVAGALHELAAERIKLLEQAEDARKRARVYDGKQLALKISANSVYGFTGATVGMLPCLAISSSVTAYGREMIEFIQRLVERKYHGADVVPGLPQMCADVVYGDTDSIMVKFGLESVQDAMKAGRHAADLINAAFAIQAGRPHELEAFRANNALSADEDLLDALVQRTEELGAAARKTFSSAISIVFEKVLWPYLLITKKRYAGGFYTRDPAVPDKVHQSGIESVRRDNSLYTAETVGSAIEKLMRERDSLAVLAWLRREVRALARGAVAMEKLVISAGLNKDASKYVSPNQLAHLVVNEKMRKREAGSEYNLGDRVPYVIVETGDRRAGRPVKKAPSAEDPVYAAKHNLQPCIDYYVNSQIRKPLERIVNTIWGEDAADALLFTPDVLQHSYEGLQALVGKKQSSSSLSAPKTSADLPLESSEHMQTLVQRYQRRQRTKTQQSQFSSLAGFFGQK